MNRNKTIKIKITIVIDIGIHNGAVTHHQDHAITFVSLRIRNTMNNIPPKPIPLVVSFSIILSLLIVFILFNVLPVNFF